ncbi:serine protease inhibitor Kazal-type 4 isoform X1 [Thalassophryne amazonica]|uniref:serine protease inhibitor Kazal-type 4 isoform X1 n=1 Tax=Thalassophryne amazonica TaxID=390379 RepID=UPI001471DCCE|nr:serine protease inhibitor Kazal-type 4 isoform X1 [Thalassophryne amazonica]
MAAKLLFLGLLVVAVFADPQDQSEFPKKPSCPESDVSACPMNYLPVCGTDKTLYPNECALCVARKETKVNILIAKDEDCPQA